MSGEVQSDGEDVSAAILGKTLRRSKALFWEYGRNTNSFAYPGIARNRSPTLAVRDGSWKLLVNADGTSAELYDVERDPNETRDLVSAHPEVAARLKRSALASRHLPPFDR